MNSLIIEIFYCFIQTGFVITMDINGVSTFKEQHNYILIHITTVIKNRQWNNFFQQNLIKSPEIYKNILEKTL